MRRRLALTAILASLALAVAQVDYALRMHFLNIGQGDATLIRLGTKGILIDAGRGDDILLALQSYAVYTRVAAVASHNHDGHIGGMDAVLADWPVGRYLYNGLDAPNRNAEAVLDQLDARGIDAPEPPWEPIVLGDAEM